MRPSALPRRCPRTRSRDSSPPHVLAFRSSTGFHWLKLGDISARTSGGSPGHWDCLRVASACTTEHRAGGTAPPPFPLSLRVKRSHGPRRDFGRSLASKTHCAGLCRRSRRRRVGVPGETKEGTKRGIVSRKLQQTSAQNASYRRQHSRKQWLAFWTTPKTLSKAFLCQPLTGLAAQLQHVRESGTRKRGVGPVGVRVAAK